MVVAENTQNLNGEAHNTVSNLMDFSINIYNIKQYFKVGSYEQLMRYGNISAPVLGTILSKSKCPLLFFQNLQIVQHLINNCSDLNKCRLFFEYLCKYNINPDIMLLLINAGVPVLINKSLESKMIAIICTHGEKAVENKFIAYILEKCNDLSGLKHVLSYAYLNSDLRLIDALLNKKCQIIPDNKFNENLQIVSNKNPNFQDNMLHFASNIQKHKIYEVLKSDLLLPLGLHCSLPVIKTLIERDYDLTEKNILKEIIIKRRHDDEILMYLFSKRLSNRDKDNYWMTYVVVHCCSFVVIEYYFNNFDKIHTLEAIFKDYRFASSRNAYYVLRQQNRHRYIFEKNLVLYDDDDNDNNNNNNNMRLDIDSNKMIIQNMIKKCSDKEFVLLLGMSVFNIEEVFIFSLLTESLIEREAIRKYHLKDIFDKFSSGRTNITNKHKNMMQSCMNLLNTRKVEPDGNTNWCVLM